MRHLKKQIKFTKTDIIIGFFLLLAFILSDVNLNLMTSQGIDHEATIIGDLKIPSINIWYFSLLTIFILFMISMLKSVNKTGFKEGLDIFAGTLGIASIIFLYGMGLLMLNLPASTQFPFFLTKYNIITIYHIFGVGLLILTNLYFTLTE